MITQSTKQKEIIRTWHLIDVQKKMLGREASRIAQLLMGKSKPYFIRNLDCGDYVVIINAQDIAVSGKKETDKVYYRHSGYPGGFRAESLKELRQRKPEEIIKHAVKGMLPQNKLRDRMLKRLHIFAKDVHPYAEKFSNKENL